MNYCGKKQEEISVQLFENFHQLPGCWNDLLPEDHFLRKDNLEVYEHIKLPDVTFLYALVSVSNKCVAAAYFQVLKVRKHHLDISRLSAGQSIGWNLFTSLIRPRLLVAGHLFRHDVASFFCSENVAPYDAYRYYHAAVSNARSKVKAIAALVKDMPQELAPYFQNYAPEYLLQRNDISMEMQLSASWQSMQDYEKALKHKYAQRFRKIRTLWDRLEVKELSVAETEKHKQQIFDLYHQVSDRQQVRLGKLNADYIPALKRSYPEDLHVWLAYENGIPVAFFSAWTTADTFDMFYIGFDYTRNDELQLYFNILFFSVEQAILSGKQKLILGRTALEAKARLGCKPRYLSTFVYIKNKPLRNTIQKLQSNITRQEGEWENRHPLK